MQVSPASYHFIPLRSKYFPQHPVLKHPQSQNISIMSTMVFKQEMYLGVVYGYVPFPKYLE
jgi:hypothetical protein